MIATSRSERVFNVGNQIGLGLLSLLFFYPFWYILVISLNGGHDAARGGIFLWPRVFSLENYMYLARTNEILQAFGISVARTIIGTSCSLFITMMVAFALTRPEMPGRRFLNSLFLFTMFFGGGLIPFFLVLRDLGLIDHFAVFVVPGLFGVFSFILMRTSIKGIPNSLLESAMLDGAGYFQIFLRVIIPLSLPVIAALGLFTGVGHWNSWFDGAFFVNDDSLRPLQTYLLRKLNTFISELSLGAGTNARMRMLRPDMVTPYSIQMAILVVVTLPIMMVYPFLQKYFVKGALIGSLKE